MPRNMENRTVLETREDAVEYGNDALSPIASALVALAHEGKRTWEPLVAEVRDSEDPKTVTGAICDGLVLLGNEGALVFLPYLPEAEPDSGKGRRMYVAKCNVGPQTITHSVNGVSGVVGGGFNLFLQQPVTAEAKQAAKDARATKRAIDAAIDAMVKRAKNDEARVKLETQRRAMYASAGIK